MRRRKRMRTAYYTLIGRLWSESQKACVWSWRPCLAKERQGQIEVMQALARAVLCENKVNESHIQNTSTYVKEDIDRAREQAQTLFFSKNNSRPIQWRPRSVNYGDAIATGGGGGHVASNNQHRNCIKSLSIVGFRGSAYAERDMSRAIQASSQNQAANETPERRRGRPRGKLSKKQVSVDERFAYANARLLLRK